MHSFGVLCLLAMHRLCLKYIHRFWKHLINVSNRAEYDHIYPPKNVQQNIITVARDPRFEGERKPRRANTEIYVARVRGVIAVDGGKRNLLDAHPRAPLPLVSHQ